MKALRPQYIANELLGVLRKHCPELDGDYWSPLRDPLFDCLYILGESSGFKPLQSEKGGSYIWDLSWTTPDSEQRRYWVELAAEIELSDQRFDDIVHDFYKILDAKARLKVFVGASPSTIKVADLRDEIDWAVKYQRFTLAEERLVAFLLDYDGRENTYVFNLRLFSGRAPLRGWQRGWKEIRGDGVAVGWIPSRV